MRVFSLLQLYLFATPATRDASSSSSDVDVVKRFYVDGNNLMGHKGTPKQRSDIAAKLQEIRNAEIVLVFDGPKTGDSVTQINTPSTLFSQVDLGTGISTDDYIQDEIRNLLQQTTKAKIEVVTADRVLRRQVLEMKPIVKGVINPVVFWKRYRPRLTGLKSTYDNVRKKYRKNDKNQPQGTIEINDNQDL